LPDGKLEEPYVIRPTSETIIGDCYSKWVQSYRDLPILINQWANVMRWEMRTRLFLRTSEFLWQEGHTAHATKKEAQEETLKMLGVYNDFMHNYLAMPVVKGIKPISERFPGANETYCVEGMMQDGKALQMGTSHFMGQNFATAYDISFLNKEGEREHAWTTSWGVTTRMIGGLIMTHSDDDGLVLPPCIAPYHIVILPIFKTEEEEEKIKEHCLSLKNLLQQKIFSSCALRVHVDLRDKRGGEKNWEWIKKGVPIRLEIGPRDLSAGTLMVAYRHLSPKDKKSMSPQDFIEQAPSLLESIQRALYLKAMQDYEDKKHTITSLEELQEFFKESDEKSCGFAYCFIDDTPTLAQDLKKYKVTPRCLPIVDQQESKRGTCILTGKKDVAQMILAKAY
jgi:prolyl-tRNA synthetase